MEDTFVFTYLRCVLVYHKIYIQRQEFSKWLRRKVQDQCQDVEINSKYVEGNTTILVRFSNVFNITDQSYFNYKNIEPTIYVAKSKKKWIKTLERVYNVEKVLNLPIEPDPITIKSIDKCDCGNQSQVLCVNCGKTHCLKRNCERYHKFNRCLK